MAVKLVQVDISQPLPSINGLGGYSSVSILVMDKHEPLGYLHLPLTAEAISQDELAAHIDARFGKKSHRQEIDESPTDNVFVSVLIPTKDRPESLRRTFDSLAGQDYPYFEIMVVDNNPSTDETRKVVEEYNHRYVLEMRPGCSWARNTAIREARGEIIAFLDDDMIVDPHWLSATVRAFHDTRVMCVTGNVLPAELETEAQELFEFGYGGYSNGFEPLICGPGTTWQSRFYGLYHDLGFVMAFRKSVFDAVGLYDVALGAGTIIGGGEDVDIIHRIVRNGFTVAYAHDALIFHYHRPDMDSLKRQLSGYGRGYIALLTKCMICEPDIRMGLLRRACGYYVNAIIKRVIMRIFGRGKLPIKFIAAEGIGALQGPIAYLISRKRVQRAERSLDLETSVILNR